MIYNAKATGTGIKIKVFATKRTAIKAARFFVGLQPDRIHR